jgi:hypothetical protein
MAHRVQPRGVQSRGLMWKSNSMKKSLKSGIILGILLYVATQLGCSSTVDEITSSIDCHGVCKRYADCFNSDYDVDGCTDKCENSADSDDERQRKLRTCNTCIDDRSCTEATFNCAADCAGIVP